MMTTPIENRKTRLMIGLIFVILVTGINVYMNPEAFSRQTEYSGFGFKFSYRGDLSLYEMGSQGSGEPTEFSGMVAATTQNIDERFLQYYVEWGTLTDPGTPEELMDKYTLDLAASANVTFSGIVGPDTVEKEGHTISYWRINGTQRGLEFMVAQGVLVEYWESLRAYRVYMIGIITPRQGYDFDELEAVFMDFMETFESVQ
jgi:hypothetical protein